MELKVRVLCSPQVSAGFELAGLTVDLADETTAGDALRRIAADPSTGVVLIEDGLRRALPDDVMQRIDRAATPIVVPFPPPSAGAASAQEDYVLEILRQAVGYRVRPR